MPKILVVDDDPSVRSLVTDSLEIEGYEVVVAIDGQDGLNQAEATMPDLVLMDLSLPRMDGWEVARRIKGNAVTRHIPIIALTAHALSDDREKAMQAGCDDYDTKPVEFPRLLGKIEALLQKRATA